MKSKFFYFAVGALALTACTSEDVVDDVAMSRNAIGFENVVNKHSRADLDNSTMKSFNVYGYHITAGNALVENDFVNTLVSKDAEKEGEWTYTGERYWMPGATYNFYAYSCGDGEPLTGNEVSWTNAGENGAPTATSELAIVDYICDHNTQNDLVYASQTEVKALEAGNSKVAFQFDHILAKVQAQFTNSFPEAYDVEISNITIRHLHRSGSYNPTDGWYGFDSSNAAYVKLLEDGATISPKYTDTGATPTTTAYVIPYNYGIEGSTEDVDIQFDLKMTSNGVDVMKKTISGTFNPNWAKGYSYTYNVVLSGSAAKLEVITFTTVTDGVGSVTNWNGGDNSETPTFKFDASDIL